MVSRNYIGVNDTIGVGRNVFLSGPALNAFIETETFNADTLIPDEFIEIPWGESKTDVIK